ncbi:MAG: glycoside hydrolase family 3 C-terminal domain-containing protein [Bacilli bacterium]|nr:glycoside hydrolase family 3 C-terminal domain-containing protein [Bacilli bacterium]
MKITRKTKHVVRGVSGIFAGILAFSLGATSVVNSYRSWVDGMLGTTSTEIVTEEVDPNVDLYNFRVKSKEATGFDLTTTKGMYDYQKDSAIKIAEEGLTLLKNENKSLPLASKSVALLGRAAYSPFIGGTMGSKPVESEQINLKTALTNNGFTINADIAAKYEAITDKFEDLKSGKLTLNDASPDEAGLVASVDKGDNAIIVIGRRGGENGYYLPGAEGKAVEGQWDDDHDVLGLSVREMATIKYAKANFKNVVVLVNSDSALDLPELFEKGGEYEANSVLWVGLPGTYGFQAVANVIEGKVAPSGHLVDTMAAKASVSAANQNYGIFTWGNLKADDPDLKNTKGSWYMPEVEGIYIGYRYYETRYFDCVMGQGNASVAHTGANRDTAKPHATVWDYKDEVVRSYGYGLSYSTFQETVKSITTNDGDRTVTAEVEVTNTGDVEGRHSVQLYVSAPWKTGDVEKSAIQLVGYEKTKSLKPGEKTTVKITGDYQYFASYDKNYAHHNVKGAYILNEGDYTFAIGNGAHDALNNVLASKGKSTSDKMDYNGDDTKARKLHIGKIEIFYSKSGEVIENQLQDMEMSAFKQSDIVELSRGNWDKTWPKTYSGLNYTDDMVKGLTCKVYEVHKTDNNGKNVVWGKDTKYTFSGMKPEKGEWIEYDDPRLTLLVEQVKLEEAIQCVTQGGGQDWDAIPSIESPAMKTTDGPVGYDAQRGTFATDWNPANTEYDCPDDDPYANIEMRPLPTMPVIGATWSHEAVEKSGEVLSMLALWSGVAEVWGPGVNIHRTPYNSRNHEYYSEDPVQLAHCGNDFAKEAQANGLVTCLKHYAFNDTEMNRSGVAPFMSEQRARECDLRAFQMAIEDEHALAVMTAFNRAGSTFSSAHHGLMTGILREEWDFKGYAVTDMVNPAYYMNARDSIINGTDSMLTSSSTKNIENGVNGWGEFTVEGLKDDMDMQQHIQDAVHHALYTFLNCNVTNGYSKDTHIVYVKTYYDKILSGVTIGSAVITGLSILGYAYIALKAGKEE